MLATTQPLSAASLRGGVVPAEDAAAAACDESFLEELEIEYNDKVAQMRALTQRLGLKYESEARMELLKLPLAVRSMTVGEFCDECGGDVEQAIQHVAKRSKASSSAAELMPPPIMQPPRLARPKAGGDADAGARRASSRRAAAPAAGAAATPSASRSTRARTAATPGGACATPSVGAGCSTSRSSTAGMMTPRMHETPRFVRNGEVMLSANGSPINLLNTVKAKARGTRRRAASYLPCPAAPTLLFGWAAHSAPPPPPHRPGGQARSIRRRRARGAPRASAAPPPHRPPPARFSRRAPRTASPSLRASSLASARRLPPAPNPQLADGSELDLAEATTRKDLSLNAEAREEAVGQLLELQAQIEAHLKAMKYGCPLDDSKDE